MILPQNNKLPIHALAGIFDNTTATYKFYWFVAMLDCVVIDLTTREQRALWLLVNHCKKLLTERFNVGINVGQSAGQSVFHVHIHLVPRYKGDVENPKGGVRWG